MRHARFGADGGTVETTRGALAELVGSFGYVLVGAGAAVVSGSGLDATGVALANGLGYGAMVAATLPLGGGLLNPAVSVGLWVAGRRSTTGTLVAIVAQLAGAILAAALLRLVVPGDAYDAAAGGTPAVASAVATGRALVLEAAAAFVLVFAAFATAIDERGRGGTAAGIVVGLTLAAGAMAITPLTGGALNPARWFGPAVVSGGWDAWYVWAVGPTAGGVVAAVLYASAFLRERPVPLP
jgi:aquaporin Z